MTWVHEGIYAAGGAFLPEAWAAFADQTGIQAVLHLCPSAPARFQGPAPQWFLWLSIAEEQQADTQARWLAAEFIGQAKALGQQVLLHSALGRHRTRWAYVSYLIWMGRSVPASLRKAAEKPWLSPYATDPASWHAFASRVRAHQSQS